MDWSMVTLSEVVTIDRNSITPENIASGTKYVGLENINSDGEFHDIQIVDNGELRSNKFQFDSHHILYGKLRPYLRKISRPDFTGICSTDILPIRCGPEMDKNFVYHYLRKQEMVDMATSRCSGANLPRLSPKILLTFQIPKPPLEEQKRIAAILDKAKEVNRGIEQSNSARNTLILSVFSDFFGDPIKNTLQFPFPKLREICTVNQGLQIAQKNRFDEPGENRMKYITIAYINGKKKPDYIEVTNQNVICTPDDILMTRTGNTGQIITDVSGIFHNNFFKVNWNRELLLKEYLCWFFRNENVRGELLKRASTTTIPDLNHGQFYEFNIPLPPINLQQKFVNILEKIKCLENVAGLATNNSLSITQELLT